MISCNCHVLLGYICQYCTKFHQLRGYIKFFVNVGLNASFQRYGGNIAILWRTSKPTHCVVISPLVYQSECWRSWQINVCYIELDVIFAGQCCHNVIVMIYKTHAFKQPFPQPSEMIADRHETGPQCTASTSTQPIMNKKQTIEC